MNAAASPAVRIFADKVQLFEAAAEDFVDIAQSAIADHGRFSVALSGGATPNGLYTLLASKRLRTRVPWSQVHVFWGDERAVAPDDPRSNYRAANELLLSHVPIPAPQVHRMRGEADGAEAAADYERVLRAHFATPHGPPRFTSGSRFDLVLLGLGSDGHTASLFPHSEALLEQRRWVTAAFAPVAAAWRITLTLPLINAAANVRFLVSGEDKVDALGRTLAAHSAQPNDEHPPASLVRPLEGALTWLVDEAAYGR